jgi:hypothetical protein
LDRLRREDRVLDMEIPAVECCGCPAHDKIVTAINLQKKLPITDPKQDGLSDVITHLMSIRNQLAVQELNAGLHDAQLQAALDAIKKATTELKTEAAKMKGVTSFINNINGVLGAATKVVNVLKNGG